MEDLLCASASRTEALLELAAWIEASKGADRELDAVAWCLAEHPQQKPCRNFFYTDREEWGYFTTNQPLPGMTFHDAPHLTSGLDAVVALLERVLPGCEWGVYTSPRDPARPFHGFVEKPGVELIAYGASSPARALLAATLRALADAHKNQRTTP